MKIHFLKILLSLFVSLFVIFFFQGANAENRIKTGMELPDIQLEGQDCIKMARYLGVKNPEPHMDLSKIPAKLIVIEFFSVFCPVCQSQAPIANKLYKIIQRNPDLKNDVKMIAVGIGTLQQEIDAYKKQYGVKFPVLIDSPQNTHGINQIPYTMLINTKRQVLYTHLGLIENLDEFITKITDFHNRE